MKRFASILAAVAILSTGVSAQTARPRPPQGQPPANRPVPPAGQPPATRPAPGTKPPASRPKPPVGAPAGTAKPRPHPGGGGN
jgi:hypothetical protein